MCIYHKNVAVHLIMAPNPNREVKLFMLKEVHLGTIDHRMCTVDEMAIDCTELLFEFIRVYLNIQCIKPIKQCLYGEVDVPKR